MINAAITVFSQVMTLFIMIAAGYIVTKVGMINENGSKQITDFLLGIVTPCMIINAFLDNFDRSMIAPLLYSVLLSVIAHVVGIAISMMLFRKQPKEDKGVLRFGTTYSNCGFMGLALIEAVIGKEGLIYGAVYVAVFNMISWTHGVSIISGGGGINLKKILFNPGTIGIIIALPLVLLNVTLPAPVDNAIGLFAGLNAPLAMVVIGSHLAQTDLKTSLKDKRLYEISFVRLLLVPLVTLLCVIFIPFDVTMKRTIILSVSAPVAASCTLLASKYGGNFQLASGSVAITTLFSCITMPVVHMFADFLLQVYAS